MDNNKEEVYTDLENINNNNINYIYTVPNSHSWINLNQILFALENTQNKTNEDLLEYLKIGIINTKERGYDLEYLNNNYDGK